MKNILVLVALLFVSGITIYGQTFPVKTIIENGPRENRINMIFLGDGYRISEMNKYLADVNATVVSIFSQTPYKEFKNLFNVYAIEVPSNESGTSHPGTAPDCYGLKDSVFTRDTYFKTMFDFAGIHRLLVAQESGKVYKVLYDNFPDYDMVMMVVNHSWYGGSGGTISVFSANVQSSEIAIHEAGHSFAGLGDEYGGNYSMGQFEGINYTWRTDYNNIPWKIWILPGTPLPTPNDYSYINIVGLFEGAYYRDKGMYRPKYDCKMRTLNVPFCEVCREQHVKSIFEYIDLIDNYLPDKDTVTIFSNASENFSINTLPLNPKSVGIKWTLDNNLSVENSSSVVLNGGALAKGIHKLNVDANYSTDFVRNDPYNLLSGKISWIVKVVDPTDVEENNNLPDNFALEQNYPNPFNPETTIKYSIPNAETGHDQPLRSVTLKVFDLLGREIATLVEEYKSPGNYEVKFDGAHLSSGTYFYVLNFGGKILSRKMILMK